VLSVTGAGVHALLSGFASILWPIVVILFFVLFHSEIADMLRRLRKGKVLGQGELGEQVTSLRELRRERHGACHCVGGSS
jgi:hypothetical protein